MDEEGFLGKCLPSQSGTPAHLLISFSVFFVVQKKMGEGIWGVLFCLLEIGSLVVMPFFYLLHLLVYCVSVYTHMAEHGCGGQRATCGSQFYHSMWALGVTLRSSGLVPARLPAELSHWHLFVSEIRSQYSSG